MSECKPGAHLDDRGTLHCEACGADLLAEGIELRLNERITQLEGRLALAQRVVDAARWFRGREKVLDEALTEYDAKMRALGLD